MSQVLIEWKGKFRKNVLRGYATVPARCLESVKLVKNKTYVWTVREVDREENSVEVRHEPDLVVGAVNV